jgi:hypothetical protein
MFRILLYALLIWFLYNLVFRFIIPIYRTSREVKKKFREMQSQMQDSVNANNSHTSEPPQQTQKTPNRASKKDYLDFEEIR